MPRHIQLNSSGKLRHLLSIEGLPKKIILEILKRANDFLKFDGEILIRKSKLLADKSIFNIFFENSTRTSTTFEIAARRLSADVINFNVNTSSTAKGESLLDTIDNLAAMQADMFVVRHSKSGASLQIAKHINQVAPHIHVMNAGDGSHAHPTQALLDMFTIQHFKESFSNLRVAIIGDIAHSRVARSNIHALSILGTPDIRVIGPNTLLPSNLSDLGVHGHNDIDSGLTDVDVVIVLRLQNERMTSTTLPSVDEYFKYFGLTEQRLKKAKPDVTVLHPGPMNRGVEIESKVADGPHSVILTQVTFGIAVRMAVMDILNNCDR